MKETSRDLAAENLLWAKRSERTERRTEGGEREQEGELEWAQRMKEMRVAGATVKVRDWRMGRTTVGLSWGR